MSAVRSAVESVSDPFLSISREGDVTERYGRIRGGEGQRTPSRKARTASTTASVSTRVTVERNPEATSSASRMSARRGYAEPSSHQARIVSSATPVGSFTPVG